MNIHSAESHIISKLIWRITVFVSPKNDYSFYDDDGRFFVIRRSVGRKSLLGAACPLMTNESNSGCTYSWAGVVEEGLITAGRRLIDRLLSTLAFLLSSSLWSTRTAELHVCWLTSIRPCLMRASASLCGQHLHVPAVASAGPCSACVEHLCHACLCWVRQGTQLWASWCRSCARHSRSSEDFNVAA